MIMAMKAFKKDLLFLIGVSLFSTALVWLPFFLRLTTFWGIPLGREGMAAIMRNFDGLYYAALAKNLSHPLDIPQIFSFNLSGGYFAAHFPLYPLLIKITSPVFGYLWSMLSISVIAATAAAVIFYLFLKEFGYTKNPFWLSLIFLFFPARWLVVRSIGSPESLFLLFLLLSFYFFKKENYWLAGIFGGLLQLTKPPGILLFIGYVTYLAYHTLKKRGYKIKRVFPLLLIPLSLLGVFTYNHLVYGDFLAYFHSGDNIHLFWPPFSVFNTAAFWVGNIWLEEIIYIYLLGTLGVILLFRRGYLDLVFFALVFLLSTFFISHRDISRYSLPLAPFLLIAFEPFLVKKEFKIAFIIILLPIYLYAINFIAGNTLPIADWTPFL